MLSTNGSLTSARSVCAAALRGSASGHPTRFLLDSHNPSDFVSQSVCYWLALRLEDELRERQLYCVETMRRRQAEREAVRQVCISCGAPRRVTHA